MAKVSVIIPIYNVEKYLKKCIDSVINQSYKNLEIILVDDESPDNCPAICDDYAKKDDRIVVIHKKNGGLSDARNHGLEISTGEYIMFLDSDDYINTDTVQKMYDRITADNSDLAIANMLYVDESGVGLTSLNNNMSIKDELINGDTALDRLTEDKSGCYVVAWNKLYKKSLFDKLRFTVNKLHEDEFIVHKIFYRCQNISCIKEPLFNYLQRSSSIMGTEYSVKRLDRVEALLERYNFYVSINKINSADILLITIREYMIAAYNKLDFKDRNVKARFNQLNNEVKKICRSLVFTNISIKRKLSLVIYSSIFNMYATYVNKRKGNI